MSFTGNSVDRPFLLEVSVVRVHRWTSTIKCTCVIHGGVKTVRRWEIVNKRGALEKKRNGPRGSAFSMNITMCALQDAFESFAVASPSGRSDRRRFARWMRNPRVKNEFSTDLPVPVRLSIWPCRKAGRSYSQSLS